MQTPPSNVPSPAGVRASRVVLCMAVSLILSPYTTSWGAADAHFVLVNATRHYLHVVINNRSYTYVAPGAAIDHEISTVADLLVDVTYSPGQGVKGNADRTVQVELQTSSTGSLTNDCSKNHSCTQTSSTSFEAEYIVTPDRWEVTPGDLSPADTTGGRP